MKAAATLTSLMMSSKTSTHSAATSPRALSRTSSSASESGRIAALPSMNANASSQHHTPPVSPRSVHEEERQNKEAAELMMFLATSPSPARRPAVKHNIPAAATRILFMGPQNEDGFERQSYSHPPLPIDRNRTFVGDSESQFTSSQASSATVVETSLPNSNSGSYSSIPFPATSSSFSQDQSSNKLSSAPEISTGTELLKSSLWNGKSSFQGQSSQEYHFSPPNISSISMNGHSVSVPVSPGSSLSAHPTHPHLNRRQFSSSKVQTHAHTSTLGAGIDLTAR
jgi:hypothetical protein